MPLPLYFNGKFYGGGMNGVHRVADRLIRACDERLQAMPAADRPRAFLLTSGSASWVPRLEAIERVDFASTGQFWEQVILPRAARDGVLVNLANLAPIAHRRKVTMLHDAQFLFPSCGYPLRQRVGYRWLVPYMVRSGEVTITVSDYSRGMLDLLGIIDAARVKVIANGVDHILDAPADGGARASLGLEPSRYVLMFGSPKAYKNNQVVFDAFAGLATSGLHLVIVGADAATLKAAGLNVPGNAVFAGPIGDGELRDLLEHALALAFPSRTEGFGLPPLEAMLCGCPAVVSPAGAIPEVCGDAAIYAGVDSPGEWRAALLAFRDDPALRATKIAAGRKRAARFDWETAGSQLWSVLTDMTARTGTSR